MGRFILRRSFAFSGRINRSVYGISFVIWIFGTIIRLGFFSSRDLMFFQLILSIVLSWFIFAQGSKRCHDIGKNGIWQVIPFYFLWLLFQKGDVGENEYGIDPDDEIDEEEIEDEEEQDVELKD